MKRLAFALAFVLAAAAPAQSQQTSEPGSELTVYLLTMGVGDLVYERFGHNAIWIRDAVHNTDHVYNWGIFRFGPDFLSSFLKGRLNYSMEPFTLDRTLAEYHSSNRSIWAQELNLSPAQKVALRDFVEWNAREENKYYRYDYYRDNCSTRVRDALDRALNGRLKAALDPRGTGSTYRSETRRLMLVDIPTLTGMNLAMGPAIDAPLSAWDEAFIPMKLRDHLRDVKVRDDSGAEVPLVRAEHTLFEAARVQPPQEAPNLVLWYLLAGLAMAALLLLLGTRRQRWARIAFGALNGMWSFVIGVLGTVIAGLWLFTDHAVTYRNENVLQANPLSFLIVIALVGLALHKPWAPTLAVRSSLLVAALALLGLVMQLLPMFNQANTDILALLLPVHLVIAWVLTSWARRRQERRTV